MIHAPRWRQHLLRRWLLARLCEPEGGAVRVLPGDGHQRPARQGASTP